MRDTLRELDVVGGADGDSSEPDATVVRVRVADVGSGAGVPGLVLAGELAGAEVTLVERREGRATWLEEAAAVLRRGGARVEVRRADVFDLARGPDRASYDVVTARAFGSPAVTAELGGALVRVGGVLVVSEPPDQPTRWSSVDLAALGLVERGAVDRAGARFQRLTRRRRLAERFPRRRAGGG